MGRYASSKSTLVSASPRLAGVAAGIALGLVFASGAARADESMSLTGELPIEQQNDRTFESDDSGAEGNDLFATIEPDLTLHLPAQFAINTHLVFEPVRNPDPGDDRAFEDHGLFVEALVLAFETERFRLFGGKFGPDFSIAYDGAPGVYGTDLAEDDIELSERVGLGASVSFGEDGARYEITGSVFFLDTSVLSESAFTNRGRTDEADGGPSNTDSLESFVAAINGSDFEQVPGLRYHVGIAMQSVDLVLDETGIPLPAIDDEYRAAAAIEWALDLGDAVTLTPLIEYARFWNAGGVADEHRHYATVSLLTEHNGFNVSLAYSGRFINADGGEDFDDFQLQTSVGYRFDMGLQADLGWKLVDEANVQSQLVGTFLGYSWAF